MSPNSTWERSYDHLKLSKNDGFCRFDHVWFVGICRNVQTLGRSCGNFFVSKKWVFSKTLLILAIRSILLCAKIIKIDFYHSWMKISRFWFSSTRFRCSQKRIWVSKSDASIQKSRYFLPWVPKIDLVDFCAEQIVLYD